MSVARENWDPSGKLKQTLDSYKKETVRIGLTLYYHTFNGTSSLLIKVEFFNLIMSVPKKHLTQSQPPKVLKTVLRIKKEKEKTLMLFKIAFDNYSSLSVATFKDGTNTFKVYNRNEALNCQMYTK